MMNRSGRNKVHDSYTLNDYEHCDIMENAEKEKEEQDGYSEECVSSSASGLASNPRVGLIFSSTGSVPNVSSHSVITKRASVEMLNLNRCSSEGGGLVSQSVSKGENTGTSNNTAVISDVDSNFLSVPTDLPNVFTVDYHSEECTSMATAEKSQSDSTKYNQSDIGLITSDTTDQSASLCSSLSLLESHTANIHVTDSVNNESILDYSVTSFTDDSLKVAQFRRVGTSPGALTPTGTPSSSSERDVLKVSRSSSDVGKLKSAKKSPHSPRKFSNGSEQTRLNGKTGSKVKQRGAKSYGDLLCEAGSVRADRHSGTSIVSGNNGSPTDAEFDTLQLGDVNPLTASIHSEVSSIASELTDSFERARDVLGDFTIGPCDAASYGRLTGHSSDNIPEEGSDVTSNASNNNKGKSRDDKKKKSTNWYNGFTKSKVLSPTYKSRSEDFKRIFKGIPNEERLIVDYSCALQKDILVHGRLYVTQNWICFYANIFRWETVLTIKCKDITAMTKEKTARVIPNAVQVNTRREKFFFTSFGTRDKTFLMLFRVWQNALMDQPMSPQELWQWVHHSYGDELGLTSSDDDYVAPTGDEDGGGSSRMSADERPQSSDNRTDKRNKSMPEVLTRRTGNSRLQRVSSKRMSMPGHRNRINTTEEECGETESDILGNGELSLSTSASHINSEKNSFTGDVSLATSEEGLPCKSIQSPNTKPMTPDAATSADIPTDMSDGTEDGSDGEVTCSGHDHSGFTTLDEIFQISTDQMFDLLFTDSSFYREFLKNRKSYDLVQSSWPDEPDNEGNKVRTITYVVSLNYSVGPKSSEATETQILYGQNQASIIYVIDTECTNSGIPYSDNFYVCSRYCITRVSQHKCRLRINCQIKYRKAVWGLVKNFIEKNVTAGVTDNYVLMAEHLRTEQERLAALAGPAQPSGRKRVRRRKRGLPSHDKPSTHSLKKSMDSKTVLQDGRTSDTPKDENVLKFNSESLMRNICLVLIFLVLFNILLFYKLYNLESRAGALLYSSHEYINMDDRSRSHEEWINLLEQQQHLHEGEIDRWKDILTSSVQLMQQMTLTLEDLQETIQKRSQFIIESRDKAHH